MAKTLPFKVAPAYAPVSKHAYEFSKRVYCRRNLLIRTATLNGQTPAFKVAPAYAPVSKRASSRSAYLYLECTQGKIGLR